MERGEYARARAHLAQAEALELTSHARRCIAEGRAIDALVPLDEALVLGGRSAALLRERGLAAFAAAPTSSAPQFLYEDATEHLTQAIRAGDKFPTFFEASRAARRIPDPERALILARRGMEFLAEKQEADPAASPALGMDPSPERIWAEAAFDAYIAKRRNNESAEELFREAEDVLTRVLGGAPNDNWARLQLTNLYQWAGDMPRALEQVRLALEFAPLAQGLHNRMQELALPIEGYGQLLSFYHTFAAARPDPVVLRNLGVISFYAALEGFEAGNSDAGAFDEAEETLIQAGITNNGQDPALASDCLGYQAIVRNAKGWCHYNAGDYESAQEAFLSMETLFEGGLAWSLAGRLPDGLSGLGFVVAALTREPNNPRALQDLIRAAEITDYLHAYRPDDGNMANDAGFVNRDAGVLLMHVSVATAAKSRSTSGPEALALLEQSQAMAAQAHEIMQRSWAAYQVAAKRLPEDVRVVNDAGLVMTYYLRDDPEAAERLLLASIRQGDIQVPAGNLPPDEQAQLEEAYGDAHQNMAILELTLRGNPSAAREWLAKSLEIGPASRQQLRPLLEDCDRILAGESVDIAQTLAGRMVWFEYPVH